MFILFFSLVFFLPVTRERPVITRGDGAAGATAVDGLTIKSTTTLRHHRSREPLLQLPLERRSSLGSRDLFLALQLPCQFAVMKLAFSLVTDRARQATRPLPAAKDSVPPIMAIIITRPLHPRRKAAPITVNLI